MKSFPNKLLFCEIIRYNIEPFIEMLLNGIKQMFKKVTFIKKNETLAYLKDCLWFREKKFK